MAESADAPGLGPGESNLMWVQLPPSARYFYSKFIPATKISVGFSLLSALFVMPKIKNILQSVRIEEYVLFVFSLILFLVYLLLDPPAHWPGFLGIGFKNVALGVKYFLTVFLFIYFYISLQLYLYLADWLLPFIEKKSSFKDTLLFLPNLFSQKWPKIKNTLKGILLFLRPLFFITAFFTFATLLLGLMAAQLPDELVDNQLMEMDKSLLGSYPFFWFQGVDNFLRDLAPLFLYPFIWLGLIMGTGWIIFYLAGQRKIFSRYILAMSLTVMIALPLWFFFPANSPQNTYLNNVYNKPIDPSIISLVEKYQPNEYLINFHKEIGVKPGSVAPISTMPSMHVAWAAIIVYYFFRFKRKTLFLTLPWFIFSTIGTVYLGQHYFIDVLAALPIALMAIWLANWLSRTEKRYYQESRLDKQEKLFKSQVKEDLAEIVQLIKWVLK